MGTEENQLQKFFRQNLKEEKRKKENRKKIEENCHFANDFYVL